MGEDKRKIEITKIERRRDKINVEK